MQIKTWRKYPIVLLGYIHGLVRWETTTSLDIYYDWNRFMFWQRERDLGLLSKVQVTHLQYKSDWGFLFYWPLCFHVWYQWREQLQGYPGTEGVIYRRIGARWEAGSASYQVPSIYFNFSTHWD